MLSIALLEARERDKHGEAVCITSSFTLFIILGCLITIAADARCFPTDCETREGSGRGGGGWP